MKSDFFFLLGAVIMVALVLTMVSITAPKPTNNLPPYKVEPTTTITAR